MQTTNQEQKIYAAKAWAEFLFAEYQLEKALQKQSESKIIESATNHDKSNS